VQPCSLLAVLPLPKAPHDAQSPVPGPPLEIWAVHYVNLTHDNRYQAQKMKTHGLFSDVHDEVGHIIVADVSAEGVKTLLAADRDRLNAPDPAEAPV
jgi:hypothetical protein